MTLACKITGHKYDGCRCTRCGQTRDASHQFIPIPGQCAEACTRCGKERTLAHTWSGCQCTRCGQTREGGHQYADIPGACRQQCATCGHIRPIPHQWAGCRCTRCGETRQEGHQYEDGVCIHCGKHKQQWTRYLLFTTSLEVSLQLDALQLRLNPATRLHDTFRDDMLAGLDKQFNENFDKMRLHAIKENATFKQETLVAHDIIGAPLHWLSQDTGLSPQQLEALYGTHIFVSQGHAQLPGITSGACNCSALHAFIALDEA